MQRHSLPAVLLVGADLLLTLPARADPPADAGLPQGISWLARPSDTVRYTGSLVGGGCVFVHRAEPPGPSEGTWGWDYVGGCLHRRVLLGWWHGRRYQGGVGAYRTDGPHILPPLP
jgi:hypothetical protein